MVKYNGKEIKIVFHCSNNKCGITIDCDINGARNIYMLFSMITCYEIGYKSSFNTKVLYT
jgi:hypothetical protein